MLGPADDLGVTHDDDKKRGDGDNLSFNSADFEETDNAEDEPIE